MAIDTRDKRASAIGVGKPFRFPLPNPDVGAEDQGDRQQIAFAYRGISAASPVFLQYPEWVTRNDRNVWFGLEARMRRVFGIGLDTGWILHSGSVYKTTWPAAGEVLQVTAMKENGASLTAGSSASLSAGQYWHDRSTKPYTVYVRTTDSSHPYSKTLIGYFTERLCGWTPYSKYVSDLNDALWRARIMGPAPTISQEMKDVVYGTAVPGTIRIVINNGDGRYDGPYQDWLWKDSEFDYLDGDGGIELTYANHKRITFKCATVEVSEQTLVATLEAKLDALERPMLEEYYDSADFSNMDPGLQGQLIADLYGRKTIPFYPVDTNLGTYKGVKTLDEIFSAKADGVAITYTDDAANGMLTRTDNVVTGVTATAKSGGTISADTWYVRVAAGNFKQT